MRNCRKGILANGDSSTNSQEALMICKSTIWFVKVWFYDEGERNNTDCNHIEF